MNRRTLLKRLFQSVAALWALLSAYVAAKYLKPPESAPSLEIEIIPVGPRSSLEVGKAKFLAHARQPVWILRLESGEVVAISAVCTHLRCILKWKNDAQIYECPCHRGSFDKYGNVLAGPPPTPLAKMRVEDRRGELYVHLS